MIPDLEWWNKTKEGALDIEIEIEIEIGVGVSGSISIAISISISTDGGRKAEGCRSKKELLIVNC